MIGNGLRIGGFSNPNVHEITKEGEKPWPGAPLPPGQTAFQHFFAPIFPYLDSVFLLSDAGSSPFVGGFVVETGDAEEMDAEFARWIVDVPVDRTLPPQVLEQPRPILHRPGVISAWGHSVQDDWCALIDLGPNEEEAVRIATTLVHLDLEEVRRMLGLTGPAALKDGSMDLFRSTVLAEARSVLRCIDGLIWEIYTENADLLETVRKHVRSLGSYDVTTAPLEACLTW